MKRKGNCGELSVELILLGLPHIVKAAPEAWPNPRINVNSTLARSFRQEPCGEMDFMSNDNFLLSINKKHPLTGLYHYLNQKVITAISNIDGSTLGDNLIKSQQALILAEAIQDEQESRELKASCSNKVGSIKLLV